MASRRGEGQDAERRMLGAVSGVPALGRGPALSEDYSRYSCLTLAVMHEDDDIMTIEGLGSPGALYPLQAAFLECDGFQSGVLHPRPDLLSRRHARRSEGRVAQPCHRRRGVPRDRIDRRGDPR